MSEKDTKADNTAKAETTEVATATATPTTTNPVLAKLAELGVTEEVANQIVSDLGASKVEYLSGLTETDLVGIGMKVLEARNLLSTLVSENKSSNVMVNPMAGLDILPMPPDDTSWLTALKTGGILKFNKDTVVGAVSAALANNVGLYDLPKKIIVAMEENAESLNEPVGAEFYEMQRLLNERSYAEIFAALPGATGRYATEARKKALLQKMDSGLWTALISFHSVLSGWVESWQAGMANPSIMFAMLAGGTSGNILPPGMMAPPPTDNLRDSAEGVINSINSIFAGTGIPVAMALAYDAQQIRKALENSNLPAQVGAMNREQMIKKLGAEVSSDYPRLEANLKRYTLSVIGLPDVSAGQTELAYIVALFQLGSQIPWQQLGIGKSPTGIGGRRPSYPSYLNGGKD